MRFGELDAGGGIRLRTAVAEPRGATLATVVLLHGRAEFIEKYAEVIERLNAGGCRVFTLDWRGQGLSPRLLGDPEKGHLLRYEDVLGDLELFLERCIEPNRAGPLVLLAHSMGGQVGLRHLYWRRDRFDGAVFSSPMWELCLPLRRRLVAEFLLGPLCRLGAGARYVPGRARYDPVGMAFEGNPLTGDRRRFQRLQDLLATDPRLVLRSPTLGWLHATLVSISRLRRLVRNEPLELPILVLSGESDPIVDASTHRRYCARMANAELVGYPEGRHELLQERDEIFEDVLARILAFVERLADRGALQK